ELKLGTRAAGAALHYLGETQKGRVPHVRRIAPYESADYMALDPQTKRNLELITSIRAEGQEGTLIGIMDRTRTAMGGRQLRRWLIRPLRRVDEIRRRLDAVEALYRSRTLRERISEELQDVCDLERLAARAATARAT